MDKNLQRSKRRHNNWINKKKAKALIDRWWGRNKNDPEDLKYKQMVGCLSDNLKNCSCWVCCNQRHNQWAKKKERLTMAERRMLDNYKEDL